MFQKYLTKNIRHKIFLWWNYSKTLTESILHRIKLIPTVKYNVGWKNGLYQKRMNILNGLKDRQSIYTYKTGAWYVKALFCQYKRTEFHELKSQDSTPHVCCYFQKYLFGSLSSYYFFRSRRRTNSRPLPSFFTLSFYF